MEKYLPNLKILERPTRQASAIEEIKRGLQNINKTISPKFFYDAEGSRLFNAISQTMAYYPTRTEIDILNRHSASLGKLIGDNSIIIEPGAGNMSKVQVLVRTLKPLAYVGIDVSRSEILDAGYDLAKKYPNLEVIGVVADFSNFEVKDIFDFIPNGDSFIAFFPGSTLGNFEPECAKLFLKQIGNVIGAGGLLLLGLDLVKSQEVLDLAYNDPEGFTRKFNLNVLQRINREYGGNFDISKFNHEAFYVSEKRRVEMHLVSEISQMVTVGDDTFSFSQGEKIHTENSYKFTEDSLEELIDDTGFELKEFFTDRDSYFALAVASFKL